jgi:hypothetical protein
MESILCRKIAPPQKMSDGEIHMKVDKAMHFVTENKLSEAAKEIYEVSRSMHFYPPSYVTEALKQDVITVLNALANEDKVVDTFGGYGTPFSVFHISNEEHMKINDMGAGCCLRTEGSGIFEEER